MLTVACSREAFDLRISSADENYISDLARELDAADVDFRVGRDGSIAYRTHDQDKVRAIDERVKKEIAARTGTRPKSEEQKKQ